VKIAIIGAGFAGLGLAYFLLEKSGVEVTIFEESHVGAGASGAASGLLHPYPGLYAKRSYHAGEALLVARNLLNVARSSTPKLVAKEEGIFRRALTSDQRKMLHSHCELHGDVEHVSDDLFFIHTGITVISENYLEGLLSAIFKNGDKLIIKKIATTQELKEFDQIVIAAGYGIRDFPECEGLKTKFLKGQALRIEAAPPYEKSFISKGYIAHTGRSNMFEVGSTYERQFSDSLPNLSVAKKLIEEKFSFEDSWKIIDVKAGVRVCMQGHYAPIIDRVKENVFVFTGLGSRGLLYHGLYGRKLADTLYSTFHNFSTPLPKGDLSR
jgi:glycine/D-amino acid oxidase-like deaminating enzyme